VVFAIVIMGGGFGGGFGTFSIGFGA